MRPGEASRGVAKSQGTRPGYEMKIHSVVIVQIGPRCRCPSAVGDSGQTCLAKDPSVVLIEGPSATAVEDHQVGIPIAIPIRPTRGRPVARGPIDARIDPTERPPVVP